MDSQIMSYKLVPIKVFEDMVRNKGDMQQQQQQQQQSGSQKRSIKDIQDLAISQMIGNVETSKDHLEIPSVEKQLEENEKKTLAGAANRNNVTWIHDEPTTMPQFSTQSKIATSLDNYLDILNSEKIPPELKVKLATLFQQKYDRSRRQENYRDPQAIDNEYPSDEDDINLGNTSYAHYSGPELAIALILGKSNITKIPLVKRLAAELYKQRKYFNWNYKGIITHPPRYRHTPHLKLRRMIDIMVTKIEKPTLTESSIIFNIIRPFYKDIKPHVKNTTILQQMKAWDIYSSQSASSRNRRPAMVGSTTPKPPPSSKRKKMSKLQQNLSNVTYESL